MLLLVVLSMLVLFMLIGTAFLMTASQQRVSATNAARHDRLNNYATKQLERALFQLVRDTDNPHSVMLGQSLLRDEYGTQGFQGVVYSPATMDLATVVGQVSRFSGATVALPLGPTAGQFVDIYVRQLGWDPSANASLDDPLTTTPAATANENTGTGKLLQPDLRHITKLDRSATGQAQLMGMPLTKGYFNGCLLTITSGAAAGQTGRILNYEYIGEMPPTIGSAAAPPYVPTRLFRFRVLTFQRGDGQPLTIGSRSPEIADLAGSTFVVNGRAYSGTGVGYNPLASLGQAKQSAQQIILLPNGDAVGAELALLPNAIYFNPLGGIGATPGVADAFATPIPAANVANIPLLNNATLNTFNYPLFAGPGDANESYDAADFQNMFLALLSVTPRAQGRVVQSDGVFSAVDPALDRSKYLRLDLEGVPLPSFHRPDLANFWYHRLLRLLTNTNGPFAMNPDEAVLAILDPYPNGTLRSGLDPKAAALITAIKRQSSMRPLREDHPNFDGSNRLSVPTNLPTTGLVDQATQSNIVIPYWQAIGPWDVDNDNDGIPDSIWIDLGDPIQEAEDGTRYKALYAFLVIDLDSRLNVNAHGLADDLNPATLAVSYDLTGAQQTGAAAKNLAGSTQLVAYNSNMLAQGVGYGPAETSLRPVFPAPWLNATGSSLNIGNRDENAGPIDSYAASLIGRLKVDGTSVAGKWGDKPAVTPDPTDQATPGLNYEYTAYTLATVQAQTGPDLAAQMKFCDYPWAISQRSCFGTPPDLFSRYSLLGLDYTGAPVYEVLNDTDAANNSLPRPLLTDSPYELNLSGPQRRDQWATTPLIANAAQEFSQSLVQNDDAPFSPTDLEKVLRIWDADSGMLPSRLWDTANAFDPLKLINPQFGDLYRVGAVSQASFGSTGSAEIMTTAQQMASVNRHLVTTDSFSLPVSGGSVPNQTQLSLGPDGFPGRAGFDDNGVNGTDDVGELNTAVSDDFRSLFGKEVAQATLFDLMRYRVWKQVRAETMLKNGYTEASLTGLSAAQYTTFLSTVSLLAEARLNGEGSTDINGNGTIEPALAQLLATDVVSGLRMDVNRPFGDGIDNNNNLVVDDSLEAGEPFLDANGNGKYDVGEIWIDMDGSKNFTGPADKLWQGLTAEPIEFDYSNGQSERVYKSTIAGGVRNLEAEGRQQYARNLYCMMLLLMDENYIAPWDENDPQIMAWIENTKAPIATALAAAPYNLPAAQAAEQADIIVKRKLTCRMVAQWAVNCVDMRDPDVISTPFEYDENPWDGWGVPDAKSVNIPIDGDAATDENVGEMIDWANVPKGRDLQAGNADDYSKVIAPSPVIGSLPAVPSLVAQADMPTLLNQTRGVVWGAERPELLITETLAFHDRRTEDQKAADYDTNQQAHGLVTDSDQARRDDDLDQGLRPRGSLFVEVQNPWPEQGQYPAELYASLDSTTNPPYAPTFRQVQTQTGSMLSGVELDRLSNLAFDNQKGIITTAATNAANDIKRSPVWRVIVVEEWPNARSTGDKLQANRTDIRLAPGVKEPKPYSDVTARLNTWATNPTGPPPWVPTNPDFDIRFGADMQQQTGYTLMYGPQYGATPVRKQFSPNVFIVGYPSIEREFYFTTDRTPAATGPGAPNPPARDMSPTGFRIRIPDRSLHFLVNGNPTVYQTQRFPPFAFENDPTALIAPILPGHVGVIGSAGTQYDPNNPDPLKKHVWTTTIGRRDVGQANTPDSQHNPDETRRIVLRPGFTPNQQLVQQVGVDRNGGDPKDEITMGGTYDPFAKDIGRDNELINDNGTVKNITDSKVADGTTTGTPNSRYYPPAVAVPIDGMNISEPPWGYGPREQEAAQAEKPPKTGYSFNELAAKGEGRYAANKFSTNNYWFDLPFDTAPELMRTGTTANYRMIHLQRLANPLLPWNPDPKLADGKTPNPEYKPNLPVNPYLTVDSSSVNLTAFNGTSVAEGDIDHTKQKNEGKMRPWIYGQGVSEELTDYLSNMQAGEQVWVFRSLERGFWNRQNLVGSKAVPNPTVGPQRVLWAQEPANVMLKRSSIEILDLIALRQMSMRVDEVPTQVATDQHLFKNHCNMVLEHSLGFGNESYGLLYDQQGTQGMSSTPPTLSAYGAPAPGQMLFTHNVNPQTGAPTAAPKTILESTNPWLQWGNRPYVSSEELLNVPSGSQATMLRFYSAGATANPYDGTGLDATGKPVPNMARLAAMRSPFGQLMNFTQTAVVPATSGVDVSDVDGDNDKTELLYIGAPNFYRILDFVQVPSRFVGTETMLNAETFNDVAGVADTIGLDMTGPGDPRLNFQPPFNKISRQRDPGRVNLNTVMGRKAGGQIWSDVFDGIMHRNHDRNLSGTQLGHLGPAWRDIVLSRKGYVEVDAGVTLALFGVGSVEKKTAQAAPDVNEFGLNKNFPTMFANPFRSPDAGDLVPLQSMVHYGVDAGWLRRHHFNRGGRPKWGMAGVDDNGDGSTDDTREAGFGGDDLVVDIGTGSLLPVASTTPFPTAQSGIPLLSESFSAPYYDGDRNPYNYYQPLSRLGNLVTNRSGVFAVWITVGYFEVEKAPDFASNENNIQQRLGGDGAANSAATQAALQLYNRIYPDGYMLGRELGVDTGNVKRARGFYIIDRTEEVGFKPGEDLNVEKMIRLRRRIE